MSAMNTPEYMRVIIYSIPRTRSHLLLKLLGSHPETVTTQYSLQAAFYTGPAVVKPGEQVAVERVRRLLSVSDLAECTYQGQIDALQQFIAKVEQEGKIPVIKDHVFAAVKPNLFQVSGSHGQLHLPPIVDRMLDIPGDEHSPEGQQCSNSDSNPTVLSDRFLLSLSPIILIRHPAHAFPSFLRALKALGQDLTGSDSQAKASFRLQRAVFEYWRGRTNLESESHTVEGNRAQREWPVVLDGDRLVADTEGVMKKICTRMGIDPALIRYSWAPGHDVPQLSELTSVAFLTTIKTSTGVQTSPDVFNVPDIAKEAKKWAQEWDGETAERLKNLVQAAMNDYEYLLQFHI